MFMSEPSEGYSSNFYVCVKFILVLISQLAQKTFLDYQLDLYMHYRSLNSKGLRLFSGACYFPHPDKEFTGGEDAYFICPDKQVIGVADGVGAWADMGVDAGEYARRLMSESLIAALEEPIGCVDTARVLKKAHSKTTCRGSSTACILALSDYVRYFLMHIRMC